MRRDLSLLAVLHYVWYSALSGMLSWNFVVFLDVGVNPPLGALFWPVGVALALPGNLELPVRLALVWLLGAGATFAANLLLLRPRQVLFAARKCCLVRFTAGLLPVVSLQVLAWVVLSKWGLVARFDPRSMP